jgi:hypothetical protein
MNIQAWMIKSWPVVQWQMPNSNSQWPEFSHGNTTVRDSGDEPCGLRGETIWVAALGKRTVAVAFEWAQLRAGVVMLADPNSIITNIRFLDDEQHYRESLAAIICLNRLAYELPWQHTVSAMVMAAKEHPEIAPPGQAGFRPWAVGSRPRAASVAVQQ